MKKEGATRDMLTNVKKGESNFGILVSAKTKVYCRSHTAERNPENPVIHHGKLWRARARQCYDRFEIIRINPRNSSGTSRVENQSSSRLRLVLALHLLCKYWSLLLSTIVLSKFYLIYR
jgi:hypothetical protein